MNATKLESRARARLRRFSAALLSAAMGVAITASALAAETVTLRVGDQKGGNRSLLEISGYAKDLPYKIEWSEFPAAAPILEALNAGARFKFGCIHVFDLSHFTRCVARRNQRSPKPTGDRNAVNEMAD